jgi:ATP-dependent Clp protease adaptor protein ClpS
LADIGAAGMGAAPFSLRRDNFAAGGAQRVDKQPWRAQDLTSSMAKEGTKTKPTPEGDLGVAERPRVEQPRRYVVVLHNDDYTTMEFVVHVLNKFFHMDETEATQVMLHVHHRGYGIVGSFTRDVAETKASQVMAYAKEHGHPLRCSAEPEGFGEGDGGKS